MSNINESIKKAQALVLDFMSELQKFDFTQAPDVDREVKMAKCWILGSTDLEESNELEKWLFDKPALSQAANERASKFIKSWKEWGEEKDSYYSVFSEFDVEPPIKNETLYDYIHRVAFLTEENEAIPADYVETQNLENFVLDEAPSVKFQVFDHFMKQVEICMQPLKNEDAKNFALDDSKFPGGDISDTPKDILIKESPEPLALTNEAKGTLLRQRAFESLLEYLRKALPIETAFIEQIFPRKRDLFYGKIRRKIPPRAYPISQRAAADVFKKLAETGTAGRANRCLSDLENLGLVLLCVTASRLRLPVHIEEIAKLEISAISMNEGYPNIEIPTFFGPRRIRISRWMARFLLALSKIPSSFDRKTIFQRDLRVLRRAFVKTIASCNFTEIKGEISHLTFISPPHIFAKHHRYIPLQAT